MTESMPNQLNNGSTKDLIMVGAGLGIVIIAILAYWFVNNNRLQLQPTNAPVNPINTQFTNPSSTQSLIVGNPAQQIKDYNIIVDSNGFSPKTITILIGSRVLWKNQTDKEVSIYSDGYPTNPKYPILNLGNFQPGFSVQLIFTQAGTYTYHNGLILAQTGTIIVTK